MNLKESIIIRQYCAQTDEAYLYETWLNKYKHHSYFAKRIKHRIFFPNHRAIINHLLEKPGIHVDVACKSDDHDTLMAYFVYEQMPVLPNAVVHFICVKDIFRGFGIAKALFDNANIDPNKIHFTHWTFVVDDLIQKYPDMTYDPYRL